MPLLCLKYKNNSCLGNKYAGYISFSSIKRRACKAHAGTGTLFIKTKNSNYNTTATNTDTVAYYHHDHLQTPIQATDKAGNIVWAASYDAFGKASIITPAATADKPTIESNLRLPGQYEDQETGLHYNYFRYYDTQTGRYISQDPIGLGGGVNAYAYVDGNPTGLVDPYGLLSMDPVWGGVYGLTGGWSPSENTVNAVAGFGDTMSWGGSAAARKFFDIDGGVNKCSAAYTAGTASAVVFSLAWGGAHFGRHASNVGATKFFVDLRQYPTIQRIWSKTVGGYKCKYELHHWFTPQSAGGASAGWNMVPVSGWLNRKMSDGGFFFEAFKYSMMGTYGATAGAIPTAITQSQKCECQ